MRQLFLTHRRFCQFKYELERFFFFFFSASPCSHESHLTRFTNFRVVSLIQLTYGCKTSRMNPVQIAEFTLVLWRPLPIRIRCTRSDFGTWNPCECLHATAGRRRLGEHPNNPSMWHCDRFESHKAAERTARQYSKVNVFKWKSHPHLLPEKPKIKAHVLNGVQQLIHVEILRWWLRC